MTYEGLVKLNKVVFYLKISPFLFIIISLFSSLVFDIIFIPILFPILLTICVISLLFSIIIFNKHETFIRGFIQPWLYFVVQLNPLLDPIIYCMRLESVRKEVFKTLRTFFRKNNRVQAAWLLFKHLTQLCSYPVISTDCLF